jgi:uncharacterized protein YpbB
VAKRFKNLLEEVRQHDRIHIPDNVRYPVEPTYRKLLAGIVTKVDSYHQSNDTDDLRRSLHLSLQVVSQMSEDIIQSKLDHAYEVRKLKSRFRSVRNPASNPSEPDETL